MKLIDIAEHPDIKTLLPQITPGESITFVDGEIAVAELKSLKSLKPEKSEPRPYALCAGQFVVPDDFDAPLPDDILADFEGE